jgi:hypothetical protein
MGCALPQDIQSALAISQRRRLIEEAIRGDEPGANAHAISALPHLALLRGLTSEMHAVLDDIADETLPIFFGPLLGELRMTFPK